LTCGNKYDNVINKEVRMPCTRSARPTEGDSNLIRALQALDVRLEHLATVCDVARVQISHWATGFRPIPAKYRPTLLAVLADMITETLRALPQMDQEAASRLCAQLKQMLYDRDTTVTHDVVALSRNLRASRVALSKMLTATQASVAAPEVLTQLQSALDEALRVLHELEEARRAAMADNRALHGLLSSDDPPHVLVPHLLRFLAQLFGIEPKKTTSKKDDSSTGARRATKALA
jgi:hypothetical protein